VSPLALSLVTATAATLLDLVPAIAAGAWLARTRSPARPVVQALVLAPLVAPPVTIGWALLRLFGRRGPLGALGLPFTPAAVVVACAVVAFPLLVRSVQLAVEQVDPRLVDAAATLGAPPARVLRTVLLPLALPGIATGAVLAFARALGEFGATALFAGNLPGRTRTVPLAVWAALQVPGGEVEATTLALVSLALSLGALAAAEVLSRALARRLR
jgi:molybdate transport system permease protein